VKTRISGGGGILAKPQRGGRGEDASKRWRDSHESQRIRHSENPRQCGWGRFLANHNESVAVKTRVSGGELSSNRNETVAVKTSVSGGGIRPNTNEFGGNEVARQWRRDSTHHTTSPSR
jgi:hypothetical protein